MPWCIAAKSRATAPTPSLVAERRRTASASSRFEHGSHLKQATATQHQQRCAFVQQIELLLAVPTTLWCRTGRRVGLCRTTLRVRRPRYSACTWADSQKASRSCRAASASTGEGACPLPRNDSNSPWRAAISSTPDNLPAGTATTLNGFTRGMARLTVAWGFNQVTWAEAGNLARALPGRSTCGVRRGARS